MKTNHTKAENLGAVHTGGIEAYLVYHKIKNIKPRVLYINF